MRYTPENAARVADNISKAAEATERLAQLNIAVEAVETTHRGVRITVQSSPACGALKGQWSRMRSEGGRQIRHMVAVFHGCLVEWDREYQPRPRPQPGDAPYWAHDRKIERNPTAEA